MRNETVAAVREFANKALKFFDAGVMLGDYYNDKMAGGQRSIKFSKFLTLEEAQYVANAVATQFGFGTKVVQVCYLGKATKHYNFRFYY